MGTQFRKGSFIFMNGRKSASAYIRRIPLQALRLEPQTRSIHILPVHLQLVQYISVEHFEVPICRLLVLTESDRHGGRQVHGIG